MSFVPAPQKASTAGTANASNQTVNGPTNAVNNVPPAAGEAVEKGVAGEEDAFITSRTFDLYWVDKTALMYRDGFVKVSLLVILFVEGALKRISCSETCYFDDTIFNDLQ
jgi:hypothetical protein